MDKKKQLEEKVCRILAQESPAEEAQLKELEILLWEVLISLEGTAFQTSRGLEYTYRIKGYEMFVSRKDKSLTMATAALALRTAITLQRQHQPVSGPKKLGTFGASYLYPVFMEIGVIRRENISKSTAKAVLDSPLKNTYTEKG